MSDTTKIYHFESLNNYVKSTKIDRLEVDGEIYDGHENIENIINEKLTDTMTQKFTLDTDRQIDRYISANENKFIT